MTHYQKSSLRFLKIQSSALCLGSKKVSSSELDKQLGLPDGTVYKKSGIRTRYQQPDRNFPFMAAKAAQEALQEAGWSPNSLDAIISVSAIPYSLIPCNAIHIQNHLGLGQSGIQCFDMNATCLGFFPALDLCSLKLSLGIWNRVLLISGDIAHPGLPIDELQTYGLFGDSATAFCLTIGDEDHCLLTTHIESYGEYSDLCQIVGGGVCLPAQHFNNSNKSKYDFHMSGHQLFKKSCYLMNDFCQRVFKSIKIPDFHTPKNFDDMDLVIPHQASSSGLKLLQRRLKISDEQWVQFVEDYGNCISGSVPMAFHLAKQAKRITKNQTIFLLGMGAGLSLAGAVLRV